MVYFLEPYIWDFIRLRTQNFIAKLISDVPEKDNTSYRLLLCTSLVLQDTRCRSRCCALLLGPRHYRDNSKIKHKISGTIDIDISKMQIGCDGRYIYVGFLVASFFLAFIWPVFKLKEELLSTLYKGLSLSTSLVDERCLKVLAPFLFALLTTS